MIHSIPTPKFVIISNDGKQAQQNRRKVGNHGNEPADFRWGFVEEFLRSRELSANTKKAYTRNLRAFLEWTDKSLIEITARDLNRYKEHLKTKPSKRGGTLSNATINQTLGSLQSWFAWLTKMDYIEKNPTLKIEQLKPDPPKALEWSKEEITALFDALTEREQTIWRDHAMLWILLHGLRASEVSALNVQDFDGKRLHILEAKADSVGTVPLLDEGIEAIENYLNWRESEGFTQDSDSPLLLSHSRNNRGDRLGYDGIYKSVKAIAQIAGVKNAHPHRGRHTIATNMILQGLDPMLAMEITRHKSPDSYKRYSKRATQIRAEEAFLQNQNLFKGQ